MSASSKRTFRIRSKLLRSLCIQHGLSTDELAHKAAISARTVKRMLNDDGEFFLSRIRKVADQLGVPDCRMLIEGYSVEAQTNQQTDFELTIRVQGALASNNQASEAIKTAYEAVLRLKQMGVKIYSQQTSLLTAAEDSTYRQITVTFALDQSGQDTWLVVAIKPSKTEEYFDIQLRRRKGKIDYSNFSEFGEVIARGKCLQDSEKDVPEVVDSIRKDAFLGNPLTTDIILERLRKALPEASF